MIFLDCGSHRGDTLEEVLKPEYPFTKVYGFEPMPQEYDYLLDHFDDERLELLEYGLLDETGAFPLFGSNAIGEASVFSRKYDADANVITRCDFVEASEFFREHIPDEPCAVMKLNCEGSETRILNNLCDTGQVWKLADVMVDWDVRKIPGMQQEETRLRERFRSMGFDRWHNDDDVMVGDTQGERIHHWLKVALCSG